MAIIAGWMDETLKNKKDEKILKDISKKVRRFAREFPIYPSS